jgi:hypothetical protein
MDISWAKAVIATSAITINVFFITSPFFKVVAPTGLEPVSPP